MGAGKRALKAIHNYLLDKYQFTALFENKMIKLKEYYFFLSFIS